MIWTVALTQELIAHKNAGLSHSKIARKMGLTRNMVCGKLNRLGLVGASGRPYKRPYSPRPLCDSWDVKLFEPYGVRKARLAAEGRV